MGGGSYSKGEHHADGSETQEGGGGFEVLHVLGPFNGEGGQLPGGGGGGVDYAATWRAALSARAASRVPLRIAFRIAFRAFIERWPTFR